MYSCIRGKILWQRDWNGNCNLWLANELLYKYVLVQVDQLYMCESI